MNAISLAKKLTLAGGCTMWALSTGCAQETTQPGIIVESSMTDPQSLLEQYQHILLGTPPEGASTADEEKNKAIVARMFLEVVNLKDYDVADEIFHPDFVWHQFDLHGPEGAKTWARNFHAGWPDVQDRIELQVAEGDWVISLVTVYGTQSGAWAGLTPSERAHVFPAIGIDRLRDGKIIERFALFDLGGVAKALGHDLPAQ